MTAKKRAAILISGRGSNMQSLIAAARAPDYPVEIVGVFSNRPDAPGLVVARTAGVATKAVSHKDFASREGFDAVIDAQLAEWSVDYVCLAGFMRIFSTPFAQKWTGRMLNVHPSLLPKFKGLKPHQQALEAGETVHGATVHWVIPELDDGPVILQGSVPILPGDTADTLSERTLVVEHRIYPEALRWVALGQATLPR